MDLRGVSNVLFLQAYARVFLHFFCFDLDGEARS